MTASTARESRPGYVLAITNAPPVVDGAVATRYARLQNTLIAWSDVASVPTTLAHDFPDEKFVILPDSPAILRSDWSVVEAPARSVCILPAGSTAIELTAPGRVICIFSPVPRALAGYASNADAYAARHPGVKPVGAKPEPTGEPGIRVFPIDQFRTAADKRPLSFQTATMNVMWIEPAGSHDRSKLNPHAHDDFEEGALVIAGEYIEHLRTPWAADSRQWREDEHAVCAPGTLIIVPPTVIHATETTGFGPHIMLNIFAPAREDHIKSGMVLNAKDYTLAGHIEAER